MAVAGQISRHTMSPVARIGLDRRSGQQAAPIHAPLRPRPLLGCHSHPYTLKLSVLCARKRFHEASNPGALVASARS
jgi:hypothetical protein